MSSSPLRPGATTEEQLDWYKTSYAQLEVDLADYREGSKELEEQLERDVEAGETRERKLKEQVEKVRYEADEWKTKHQQAKTESNNAYNQLQKEITKMREENRNMQLKLRDIEVVNDDYERQARNTESSLEDMESKYNVAIERGVLLESEMKTGEQERETLRIESQRLRDELSELKVESEITLEKLRAADDTIERLRSRKPSPLAVESLRARSPGSEASGITPSSPTMSTPPPKSDSASEAPTPPSPPLSDTPANGKPEPKTPVPKARRSLIPDTGATPRPGLAAPKAVPKHARGPSTTSSGGASTSDAKAMRPPMRPRQVSRPSNLGNEGLPRSDSLYQIRSLRGRMQKIEERVQSARSKLPAPRGGNTPKGSPRSGAGSAQGEALPSSVTMRRSVRRPPSNIGSQAGETSDFALFETPSRRESKRLSTGIPRPPSVASDRLSIGLARPPSVASERPTSALDRPPSAAAASRPSSRHSLVGGSASVSGNRPGSRIGARTPVGDYAGTNGTAAAPAPARSNSSIAGNYATVHNTPRTHRPSASVSELRRKAAESEDSGGNGSPGRVKSALPTPLSSSKRQSGNLPQPRTLSKRTSTGLSSTSEQGAMRPPPRRQMSDLGETY